MTAEITVTYQYSIAVPQSEYDDGTRVYRCTDCDARVLCKPVDGLTGDMTCQQCTNNCVMVVPTYNGTTEAFEWTK